VVGTNMHSKGVGLEGDITTTTTKHKFLMANSWWPSLTNMWWQTNCLHDANPPKHHFWCILHPHLFNVLMSHQSMLPKLKNYGNNSALGRSLDNSEEKKKYDWVWKKARGFERKPSLTHGESFGIVLTIDGCENM